MHRHPAFSQRQRDASCPDPELERPASSRSLHEEGHRGLDHGEVVHGRGVFVIPLGGFRVEHDVSRAHGPTVTGASFVVQPVARALSRQDRSSSPISVNRWSRWWAADGYKRRCGGAHNLGSSYLEDRSLLSANPGARARVTVEGPALLSGVAVVHPRDHLPLSDHADEPRVYR